MLTDRHITKDEVLKLLIIITKHRNAIKHDSWSLKWIETKYGLNQGIILPLPLQLSHFFCRILIVLYQNSGTRESFTGSLVMCRCLV